MAGKGKKQDAMTVARLAKVMRELDFGMLSTHASDDADGALRARPMSNNREVEFDGDVWFFSAADSRKVADVEADDRVELSFADPATWRFISMTATATVVRDVAQKRRLWVEELERWFEGGPESDDIVLLKVTPSVVAYWLGDDGDGELAVA